VQKFSLYFRFYSRTFLPPLFASLFVYFQNGFKGLSILVLAVTLCILFLYRRFLDDPRRKQLYFYFNLGMTELKLYGFVFLVNFLIVQFCFLFL